MTEQQLLQLVCSTRQLRHTRKLQKKSAYLQLIKSLTNFQPANLAIYLRVQRTNQKHYHLVILSNTLTLL